MISRMLPPLPVDATPEQASAHFAQMAREDAADWQFFGWLITASFIVLSVVGYVLVSYFTS